MATLSSPTIDDLIQDVRNMLSQPSATNSFWTDEELASYLNAGVRRYFMKAVEHLEGQFTTTVDLDIVSGSNTIALPSDFFSIKVLWRKNNGDYEPLAYRNNLSEGYITQGSSGGGNFSPDYYLRGNSLVLSQTPNFNETGGLKVEYVQFPETMITGGDSLTSQVSPVFKDLIIMYAVYQAKVKESLTNGTNTTGVALQNLNDLFTAFQDLIPGRSAFPTAIKPFNPESGDGS
jgi:hypothetical protein